MGFCGCWVHPVAKRRAPVCFRSRWEAKHCLWDCETWEVQWNFSQNGVTTLPKTNSLHLAGGRAPKGNSSFNSSVSGCYVSFKEGRCSCEMSKKQNRINGSSKKGLRTCTELASGEMIMKSSGMKVLTSDWSPRFEDQRPGEALQKRFDLRWINGWLVGKRYLRFSILGISPKSLSRGIPSKPPTSTTTKQLTAPRWIFCL